MPLIPQVSGFGSTYSAEAGAGAQGPELDFGAARSMPAGPEVPLPIVRTPGVIAPLWEGFASGVAASTAGTFWRKATSPDHTRDFNFVGTAHFAERLAADPNHASTLTPKEHQILLNAKSKEHYDYILQVAQDRRLQEYRAQEHPVTSFIGNIAGDAVVDAALGGAAVGVRFLGRRLGVQLTGDLVKGGLGRRVGDLVAGATAGTVGAYSLYAATDAENATMNLNDLLNGTFMGVGAMWSRSARSAEKFAAVPLIDSPAFQSLTDEISIFKRRAPATVTEPVQSAAQSVRAGAARLMANSNRTGEELLERLGKSDWMLGEDARRVVQILQLDHMNPAESLRKLTASMDGRVASSMRLPKELAQQYAHLTSTLLKKFMPADARVILTSMDDTAKGMTIPVGKGTYLVNIAPEQALTKEGFGTLFHELGHIIINHHFQHMPEVIKKALLKRFEDARRLAEAPETAELAAVEMRAALSGMRAAAATAGMQGKSLVQMLGDGKVVEGMLSLPEYMAEQFVKVMQDELLKDTAQYAQNQYQKDSLEGYVRSVVQKLSAMSKEIAPHAKAAPEAHAAFQFAATRNLPYDYAGYKASLKDTSMSLAENSLNFPNASSVIERAEGFLGGGWASLYEKMAGMGQDAAALAKQLVVDPLGTSASSAAMDVRRTLLNLGQRGAAVERAITDATGFSRLQQFTQRSAFLERYNALNREVVQNLHQRHLKHIRGEEILPHPDPVIDDLLQKYHDSQWAPEALREWQSSGVRGADAVTESPWYFPVQHSGERIHEAIQAGRITLPQVQGLYAQQFKSLFPKMTDTEAQAAGARMVQNVTDPLYAGHKPSLFVGITRNEVEQTLIDAGIESTKLDEFLRTFENVVDASGKPKNMQRRMEWDMSLVQEIDGTEWGVRDFLNTDMPQVMNRYSRVMAGRAALARQGFDSLASVDSAITAAARTSKDPRATREVFENAVDSLLGRHVGERLPDTVRSMGSLAAFLSLKNSGLYNVIDLAQTMHHYGVVKTIQALRESGLTLLEHTSAAEAKRMQDVLSGGLVAEGRWKSVIDLMDDGYQVPGASVHEAIQHGAQAGKFLNGMEFVRRKLVQANSNLAVDAFYAAARGDATLAQKLSQYGATPDLLLRVQAQLQKHGNNVQLWEQTVLRDSQNVLLNMVDNVVQMNRLGEIPAFMQFSPVARVMLPYLNFAAGAHNKILRRTLKYEEGSEIAGMMAFQIAFGAMAASAANIVGGREWDDNLSTRAVSVTPMSGWFGVLAESMQNGMRTQVAPYAVLTKAQSAVSTVIHGDMSPKALLDVTGIAVIPGMVPLLNYLDEETGANARKAERLAEDRAQDKE